MVAAGSDYLRFSKSHAKALIALGFHHKDTKNTKKPFVIFVSLWFKSENLRQSGKGAKTQSFFLCAFAPLREKT